MMVDILSELHYLYDKDRNAVIHRAAREIEQLRADIDALFKLLESKATTQEVMDTLIPTSKKKK
jgi:hypothetical protein